MSAYAVEVQVDPAYAERLSPAALARAARATLAHESQPPQARLTVVIVNEACIRALNRDYRGRDEATDVLAFGAQEGEPFVLPEDEPPYLGDVIISYPQAEAQAIEAGRPVAEELTLLVVHGCLHLLGYDHADEAGRRAMWQRQETILAGLA